MTLIAGLAFEGKVYLIADSISMTYDMEYTISKESKLFTVGQVTFASAGSIPAAQLVQYNTEWLYTYNKDRWTPIEYLIKAVVPAIRATWKAFDVEPNDMLCALDGHLFVLQNDGGVFEVEYYAIGNAAPYVMSYIALRKNPETDDFGNLSPKVVLRWAFDHAADFSKSFCPPYVTMEV